ncbi:MAG: polyprenyl synthetase family protein [Thermoplasmatota archaeon]
MSLEARIIERHISDFLDSEISATMTDPLTREVMEAIKEFTLRGGKRVRAILLIKGYQAVGGEDIERIRRASISMELIQTMLLIHDDIIDRSPERRGSPSFHEFFRGMFEDRGYDGDGARFGESMGIIAGDLAETLAEKSLIRSGFPESLVQNALLSQTDMIRDTGFGQIMDIYSGVLPDWGEENVMKVHEYKTARYTFDGPLHIGAVLNEASGEQLKALSGYAIPAGIAFQLVDDILGFFGDPARGGPSDLSDIKEGKRTLLIIKAMELADPADRKEIESALGNPNISPEAAEVVRDIVRRCGSERYSRDLALNLHEQAIGSLEGGDLEGGSVEFLAGFSDYLLNRI